MVFRLRSKFLITLCLVLLSFYGLALYRILRFQDQMIIRFAERQARMLSKQIILTRKWVADHNGLFFLKAPGVDPNPFLDSPTIHDDKGRLLVKRNPAMVTKELSQYANESDFCRFRVTSLKPINPENRPDAFEKKSLHLFEQGQQEVIAAEQMDSGRVLRYMTPLTVEFSCLECHKRQGYSVGDIRGGLSLTIPLAWADRAIKGNNWVLLGISVFGMSLVGAAIYLLVHFIVVRRLDRLAFAMQQFPEQKETVHLPAGQDEIGILSQRFSDLSERLQASQRELEKTREKMFQTEKMASLGRLSAGIVHEVNNPLGGMRNCLKSMREKPDDQELRQRYLELLDKGLKRVENTMRQLLNFGRQEPLRLREVVIEEVIRECFELIAYTMKNIDVRFDFQLAGSWQVDVEALRQIVVNIGLNAVQSMHGGGVVTTRTWQQKERIYIAIRDTGAGIPQENIRTIFDPFFTTKDVGHGTGLGLAVSYAHAQKMGGTIHVESTLREGSCFTVELPAVPPGA